jgi:hypothetical protein
MNQKIKRPRIFYKSDCTSLDNDADKTGSDNNADHTMIYSNNQRFNKPSRETDPDQTGGDIQTDFTTGENANESNEQL